MKAVYVSGPYSAPTNYKRRLHVWAAWTTAAAVWGLKGAYAVCPHCNTEDMDGAAGVTPEEDYGKFIEADLDLVARCDAVLMLPGWERSHGARLERNRAAELGKPIFDTVEEVRAWLAEGK